jgi:hypothetical protein
MTNNQPAFDHIRWWEFELKTRELYQKRYADAYKQASEFSKLVLTNLHLINAGGLVALPWLASFTNTAGLPTTEKFAALGPSIGCFIAGLACAALSSLFTYYNLMRIGERAETDENREITDKRQYHPLSSQPDFQSLLKNSLEEYQRLIERIDRRVGKNYRAGHAAGWLSAIFFVAGCCLLVFNAR